MAKATGQVVKGLLLGEINTVSFLASAGANFVVHFSSGRRTMRIPEAFLPVRGCAGDYHKSPDKKAQWSMRTGIHE